VTSVEVTILNRRSELVHVTRLVDDLAVAHHLPGDVVADVNVALDEVLTNIIAYGYDSEGDGGRRIRVRLRVDGDLVEAEVVDDGRPFDPTTHVPADVNVNASLRERRVGGLGIHFVKQLMTDMTYTRAGNQNRLVLRKRLAKRSEADRHGSS
jgi:anti-sigma regulatory factor (Ser/Thr protein kinase)